MMLRGDGREQGTMRDKGDFVTSSEDSVSLRKGEKRNSDERENRLDGFKELTRFQDHSQDRMHYSKEREWFY